MSENKCDRSFNLIDEPWIPVVDLNLQQRKVGLRELFESMDRIFDLATLPLERISIMRLLQCIAYASCPEGTQWQTHKQALKDNAVVYLDKWRDSFWLHDAERPFLQIPDITSDKGTAFAKLNMSTSAAGANALLSDHFGEEATFTDARLALALLSFQNFALGGRSSTAVWAGEKSPKNGSAEDAPCCPSSMAHTFIRTANLLESLKINLPPLEAYRFDYPGTTDWIGRPIWEQMPRSLNDIKAVENATRTFVGRLVPLSRAVLLRENDALLGEALRYPRFGIDNFSPEPSSTIKKIKKKDEETQALLGLSSEKAAWRELHAILSASENGNARGPKPLQYLDSETFDSTCEVLVCGIIRDQAKIIDVVESAYPINHHLLSDVGRADYERGVQIADQVAGILKYAAFEYARCLSDRKGSKDKNGNLIPFNKVKQSDKADIEQAVIPPYWNSVPKHLDALFQWAMAESDEEAQENRKRWCSHLCDTALQVFDEYCTLGGFKEIKGYTKGRRILNATKIKLMEDQ